jgi:hypothetical protein
MTLSNELCEAFASEHYDAEAARKLLTPMIRGSAHEKVVAARAVGAALRAFAPERARAAALLWAREVVSWKGVREDDQNALCGSLGVLMQMEPRPGRSALCDIGALEFKQAFFDIVAPHTDAPEVGVDLLAWLEFGDEDAFARLQELAPIGLRLSSIASFGERAERFYAVARIPVGHELEAEIRWLGTATGRYGLATAGARSLGKRLGIPESELSSGLNCNRSSRSDLHAEEHKPLIDVLAKSPAHHSILRELIPEYQASPWMPKALLGDMLESVPWDERFDRAPQACVRRWGTLLFTQNASRVNTKLEKTEAAAIKAFAKKRKDLEAKLGPPTGDSNLDTALHEAARECRRPEVRRLLALGAKPDNPETPDDWTALTYRAGDDPEVIRMYADAGADLDLPTKTGLAPLDLIALKDPTFPLLASARVLLERGAKGRGHDGASPIHHAARKGNADLVELLVAHGARANEPAGAGPYAGKTPLDLAREAEAHATIAVLTRRG